LHLANLLLVFNFKYLLIHFDVSYSRKFSRIPEKTTSTKLSKKGTFSCVINIENFVAFNSRL